MRRRAEWGSLLATCTALLPRGPPARTTHKLFDAPCNVHLHNKVLLPTLSPCPPPHPAQLAQQRLYSTVHLHDKALLPPLSPPPYPSPCLAAPPTIHLHNKALHCWNVEIDLDELHAAAAGEIRWVGGGGVCACMHLQGLDA